MLHGYNAEAQEPLMIPCADSVLDQEARAKELYQPIRCWQTRIIYVHPGIESEPLQSSLFVADIIQAEGLIVHTRSGMEQIPYCALSYRWGPPDFKCILMCNDVEYPVTKHLYTALLRLRRPKFGRYIWIDALCICQYDPDERSTQVRNMFNIFLKASQTVVWLGELANNNLTALYYMRRADSPDYGKILSGPSFGGLRWCESVQDLQRRHQRDRARSLCADHLLQVYQGATELYRRSWNRRIWVRQEMFTARDIILQIGHKALSWYAYKITLADITSMQQRLKTLGSNYIPWDRAQRHTIEGLVQASVHDLGVIQYHHAFEREKILRRDILQVLECCGNLEASDPRDHVYAILGMTDTRVSTLLHADTATRDGGAEHVVPTMLIDYTRPVSHVFQDFTKFLINRNGNLDLMYARKSFGMRSASNSDLPSWTTNWSAIPADGYQVSGRGTYLRREKHLTLPELLRDWVVADQEHTIEEKWRPIIATLPPLKAIKEMLDAKRELPHEYAVHRFLSRPRLQDLQAYGTLLISGAVIGEVVSIFFGSSSEKATLQAKMISDYEGLDEWTYNKQEVEHIPCCGDKWPKTLKTMNWKGARFGLQKDGCLRPDELNDDEHGKMIVSPLPWGAGSENRCFQQAVFHPHNDCQDIAPGDNIVAAAGGYEPLVIRPLGTEYRYIGWLTSNSHHPTSHSRHPSVLNDCVESDEYAIVMPYYESKDYIVLPCQQFTLV